MSLLITTDLDRTLLFSRRAISELGGDLPALVVEQTATTTIELAEEAARLLAVLGHATTLVPATTRTPAQLARVTIEGLSPYAVAANGAIVLIDGRPDPGWSPEPDDVGSLVEARRILADADRSELVRRQGDAADHFVFAVTDSPAAAATLAARAGEGCAEINWRAVSSGRKIYLIPRNINKASAVRYLRDRIEAENGAPILHLAAGDNALDLELLGLADSAWVPCGSDLAQNPTAVVAHHLTSEPGHRAAVEICAAWAAIASGLETVTWSQRGGPRR